MKTILALILLLCFSFASATQLVLSGLTDEQVAKLNLEAAKMKNDELAQPAVGPDRVEKWVSIGANIGKGLAGAAKEVGVAVNDFSNTRVGTLTMYLIVWKMAGMQMLHVIGGGIFFLIMLPIWFYMYRRLCVVEKTVTVTKEDKSKEVTVYNKEPDSGFLFGIIAVLVGIVAVTGIIMFTA